MHDASQICSESVQFQASMTRCIGNRQQHSLDSGLWTLDSGLIPRVVPLCCSTNALASSRVPRRAPHGQTRLCVTGSYSFKAAKKRRRCFAKTTSKGANASFRRNWEPRTPEKHVPNPYWETTCNTGPEIATKIGMDPAVDGDHSFHASH